MTVEITHKGWMLFCPIWWVEKEQMPIPRLVPGVVLECAMLTQDFINWVLSFVYPDACGFIFTLETVVPFSLQIPDFQEQPE